MTDKAEELYESAKAVLKHLEASTDALEQRLATKKMSLAEINAIVNADEARRVLSPADQLRKRADEMEARDAEIIRFRKAVAEFEEANGTEE